jgi:hypothetical protein
VSRPPDRTLFLAAGGFALAALVFAAALARALTIEPTPPDDGSTAIARADAREPAAANDRADSAPDDTGRDRGEAAARGAPAAGAPEVDAGADRSLTLEALTLAVDNDPFQPDRRRPPEPYRMPGDIVDEPEEPAPVPPPPFRLLGTAETGTGGLAVMQVEDALPRVLVVGESLLGYTLSDVKGDAATMTGQGRTLTLTVAQASPNPEPPREQRTQRRGNESPAERARMQREEALQRAIEGQLRGREGAAIEELRRLIEQRGQAGRDIQLDNGRVIIRPRGGTDTMMVTRRPPGG